MVITWENFCIPYTKYSNFAIIIQLTGLGLWTSVWVFLHLKSLANTSFIVFYQTWDGGGKTKIDEKIKMHIWLRGAVHVS